MAPTSEGSQPPANPARFIIDEARHPLVSPMWRNLALWAAMPARASGDVNRVCNYEASLTLRNTISEIARAAAWLDALGVSLALPPVVVTSLQIAMDEVLTNVITHGLKDSSAGSREISVDVALDDRLVELCVSDDGPAFDPTAATPPNARISARELGGVGLLFVRTLMDDVRFRRRDGRNYLTLCKRLASSAR